MNETVGSICFLPQCAVCYRQGVWLYAVGGVIYLKCAIFDYEEALNSAGGRRPRIYEAIMNEIYVVGTAFYLVATLLYAPLVADAVGEFRSEAYGGIGFILGSICFIFASSLNGMHTGTAFAIPDDYAKKNPHIHQKILFAKAFVVATSTSTLLGSLLFLVGSVLYLPMIGCNSMTTLIGTYHYLIGSVFFVIAGCLPVLRRKCANIENLQVDDKKTDKELKDIA